MAALSSVFLRPRALGVNPFPMDVNRREDFMRTTGVYKVALVGGGGGGAGGSPNLLYYGDKGLNAGFVFDTVRVRDSVTVTVGEGGSRGSQGMRGGNGGQTTLVAVSTVRSIGGSGGLPNSNINFQYNEPRAYRVISGGARPDIRLVLWSSGGTQFSAGLGGSSGQSGNAGQIFYNLIFRVA